MMGAGTDYVPSAEPDRPRRRGWVIAVVALWIVVVAGLAFWSVGHERATVPEQRDINQAVPDVQRAAGVVFAASGGPGRAVTLGELTISTNCRVTPVRAGVAATRDISLQVRAGEARAALEAIATALPANYRADVAVGRGGTRFSLHADAGNFVAIDSDSDAGARDLTVRVSSGCRPHGPQAPPSGDPSPIPSPPPVLDAVLRALNSSGKPDVRTITCPDGGTAGTYVVEDIPAPADLPGRLRFLGVTDVVRDDDDVRAYRTGTDSVVVTPEENRLRVAVSTAC
nr:hypothetical protein [uncultured Actinoplanes sp.]